MAPRSAPRPDGHRLRSPPGEGEKGVCPAGMSPDMSVVVHLLLEAVKSRGTPVNGGELSVRLHIVQLALVDRNRST